MPGKMKPSGNEKHGQLQRIHIRRRSSVESLSTPRSPASTPVGLDGAPDPMYTPRGNGSAYRRVTTTERDAALYSMAQALVPVLNTPEPQAAGAMRYWPFGAGTDLPLVPPPLAPGVLPDVRMSDFDGYIRIMSDRLRRFEDSRQRAAQVPEGEQRLSLVDIAAGKSPHMAGEGLVKAMEAVPSMFFSEEFSLSRPETWHAVCPSEDEAERAEKVEEYGGLLDVVETQLLQEIAVRSDHFFEAAAVVQDLGDHLGRAYEHVHQLRTEVRALDEDVLRAAVDVQRLRRQRANLVAVAEKLKVVEDVANFQEALALLLPQGDFAGALDVCDDLRATLASKELDGLHVARHLPEHLAKTSEAINDLMETQFLAAMRHPRLAAVVEEAFEYLEHPGAGFLEDAASAPLQLEGGEDRDLLLPLVLGLWRAGRLEGALGRLRDEAASDVKGAMRDIVERGVPLLLQGMDINAESLAEKLLALSPAAFARLLHALTSTAASCLENAAAVQALVADVLQGQEKNTVSRAQLASVRALCADVLQGMADAAQTRWMKLLGSRASSHARLRLPELTEVLALSENFANIAQRLGAKPGVALRNAVQVQCKAFLDTLHSRSITHLSGLLEQEGWVAAEVPRQAQRLVDCLQQRAKALEVPEAGGLLPPNGTAAGISPGARQAELLSVMLANDVAGGTAGAGDAPGTHLRVGGSSYVVVRAVLALLRLLQDYAAFQETVPALAAEVAHRVVELVKVFNSRTCQLVLGAGAMQLAGLKSITAKHLALSAQCLGSLIALQPTLMTVFTASIPGPRRSLLLPDFQRAGQDLRIHRSEIHSKLVAIMRERLAANLKQLPALAAKWGGPPGARTPSAFALTNAKQLRILSQVLSPLLLEQELYLIFGQVAVLFSNSLANAFSRLVPLGLGWEEQCLADAEQLLETLRSLPMDPNQQPTNVDRLSTFCTNQAAKVAALSADAESAAVAGDEGHLDIQAHISPPPSPSRMFAASPSGSPTHLAAHHPRVSPPRSPTRSIPHPHPHPAANGAVGVHAGHLTAPTSNGDVRVSPRVALESNGEAHDVHAGSHAVGPHSSSGDAGHMGAHMAHEASSGASGGAEASEAGLAAEDQRVGLDATGGDNERSVSGMNLQGFEGLEPLSNGTGVEERAFALDRVSGDSAGFPDVFTGGGRAMSRIASDITELTYARRETSDGSRRGSQDLRSASMRSTLETLEEPGPSARVSWAGETLEAEGSSGRVAEAGDTVEGTSRRVSEAGDPLNEPSGRLMADGEGSGGRILVEGEALEEVTPVLRLGDDDASDKQESEAGGLVAVEEISRSSLGAGRGLEGDQGEGGSEVGESPIPLLGVSEDGTGAWDPASRDSRGLPSKGSESYSDLAYADTEPCPFAWSADGGLADDASAQGLHMAASPAADPVMRGGDGVADAHGSPTWAGPAGKLPEVLVRGDSPGDDIHLHGSHMGASPGVDIGLSAKEQFLADGEDQAEEVGLRLGLAASGGGGGGRSGEASVHGLHTHAAVSGMHMPVAEPDADSEVDTHGTASGSAGVGSAASDLEYWKASTVASLENGYLADADSVSLDLLAAPLSTLLPVADPLEAQEFSEVEL